MTLLYSPCNKAFTNTLRELEIHRSPRGFRVVIRSCSGRRRRKFSVVALVVVTVVHLKQASRADLVWQGVAIVAHHVATAAHVVGVGAAPVAVQWSGLRYVARDSCNEHAQLLVRVRESCKMQGIYI